MARKCSSCGNNGHNSRTCGGGHGRMFDNGGGVRLFGVQLHVGSSSPMAMKKCFSMECLSSSAAPAYYAAALAAAAANNNSSNNNSCSSPSVSPASSLVSVEEAPEKMATNGYLSDGLMGRVQERKKGVPWTEDEHRRFLAGLEKLGKGDWRGISRHFVTTRTPTQVASHAQKYFLRQSSLAHKKRRSSLFDVVENAADRAAASAKYHHRSRLMMRDAAATPTSSSPPETTDELPALSLGISVPSPPPPTATTTARPARALLPPSLSMQLLPWCSAAMSTTPMSSSSPAKQQQQQHPPSLALAVPSSKTQPQPDLEFKISTTTARPSEPTAAASSPRTPPFLGTIRVT